MLGADCQLASIVLTVHAEYLNLANDVLIKFLQPLRRNPVLSVIFRPDCPGWKLAQVLGIHREIEHISRVVRPLIFRIPVARNLLGIPLGWLPDRKSAAPASAAERLSCPGRESDRAPPARLAGTT